VQPCTALYEVIGEVKWLDGYFHATPEWLNAFLPSIPFAWFEALWFLVLFPLLVWAGISGISYLMGHRGGFRTLLLAAATGAAPIVAAAHLAKAAAKVASWGGFLPLAVRDPEGVKTLHQIVEDTLIAPAGMLGLSMVGGTMLVLTLLLAWRALRWIHDVPTACLAAARSGLLVTFILFIAVLAVWVWPAA